MGNNRPVVRGMTIDSLTSKDLDDAIWVETFGCVGLLQVHIADPTESIEIGDEIEQQAQTKLLTKYLPKGNIPMLPPELSEGQLSLLPLQERNALTVEARVDVTGEILNYSIYESRIISVNQFSYEQVEEILYEKKGGFYFQLKQAEIWKEILSTKRASLGALGSMQRKCYFTDEEGKIIGDYSRAQSLIAEYAILANTLVAQWLKEKNLPAIFRNHQPIAKDTKSLRIHLNNGNISTEERAQYYHLLGKAKYSSTNQGHFALALPGYVHFTSPLRRFADFAIHRVIKAYLNEREIPYGERELEAIAEKINRKELQASQFKREKFKQKRDELFKSLTDYKVLNDKELFKLIKGGDYLQEALEATFLQRIKDNNLKERATAAGLFLTESQTIRGAIVKNLSEQEIFYTLNLASNLLNEVDLQFTDLCAGENPREQQFKFQIVLTVSEHSITTMGQGRSKKEAKLNAAIACLSKWVENCDTEMSLLSN